MALFTFISILLLTALHLHTASSHSSQSEPSPVVRIPAQASETANQGPVFTLPASADVGKNILPNVKDPEAVDPQTVCPGYKASNVRHTDTGFTADLDLAGPPCNVYGNDVEHLNVSVRYHFDDRVSIEILPRYIGPENETWFFLPTELVPRPNESSMGKRRGPELAVSWSNDPTFSFTIKRKKTGDTLFSTEGKVLVYEDQFIEFASPLPENYNLYGLGEVIHGFRLGNNLTSKPGTRAMFSDSADSPRNSLCC
jgi:alpha-glucosidase